MRIYHIPSSDIPWSVDSNSYILTGTAINTTLLCADASQILIAENVMTPLLEHQTIAVHRISQSNTYIRRQTQPTLRPSPRSPASEYFKTMNALNCRSMGTGRILIHRHQEPTHSSSLDVQSVRLGHEQIQMERDISFGIVNKLRTLKRETPDSFSRMLKTFFSSPH